MPNITIDESPVSYVAGESVIEAATRHRIEIPHYCWHPRLSVAANCRMCLVEVEKSPKLVPACQTECKEGMVVRTHNERVQTAQRQVHEFLLINHPIDCPICDQAGECKLQDYYMRYQLTPSRMREPKVYKPKLTRLGPHVVYNAQRCIMCTRCVRFMDEVAHDRQLGVMNRGDHSEIGTFPEQPLDNPYSLNTVDVCPVGALTSTVFRFKQRVWNLKRGHSICPGCSKGCNVRVDYRSSQVYRLLPRENEYVNRSWMCDEGRLTYAWANERRIEQPLVKDGDFLRSVSAEEAIEKAAHALMPQVGEGVRWALALGLSTTIEQAQMLVTFVQAAAPRARVYTLARADGEADAILRQADKNPNRKGVMRVLTQAGFTVHDDAVLRADLAAGRIDVALLCGHDSPEVLAIAEGLAGVKASVHLAPTHGPLADAAQVTLPVPSWVETQGTWHSGDDRLQALQAAFAPKPSVRSLGQWLGALAKATGIDWRAPETLQALAQTLSAPDGAYAGVDLSAIGPLGHSLGQANDSAA